MSWRRTKRLWRRRVRRVGGVPVVVAAFLVLLMVGASAATILHDPESESSDVTIADLPSTDTASPPAALWIGDSYTGGVGTTSSAVGEACRTSSIVGWACLVDAQGSTGFVSDGAGVDPSRKSLAGRLAADVENYIPDVVVIDAGRNDGPLTPKLRAAIDDYYGAVREAFPDAVIVQIAPYWFGTKHVVDPAVTEAMSSLVGRVDGYLIDPVAQGWISPRVTRSMTAPDGEHPSPEGHQYIARKLADELSRLGVVDRVCSATGVRCDV